MKICRWEQGRDEKIFSDYMQDDNVAVRGIKWNLARGGPSAVTEIRISHKTVLTF